MSNDNSRLIFVLEPNDSLNISHYHGVIKQVRELQYQYNITIIICDIKHICTNNQQQLNYKQIINDIVIDLLVSGIDPSQVIICVESQINELAELQQILSAITPLGWLERVQSYKEIIEELDQTELSTYGLLGAPLLYSSYVLAFDAGTVLDKTDNVSYIELSREIARRFNYLYGREDGFEDKAHDSIAKLGDKKAELYLELLTKFQQDGDESAEEKARYLIEETNNLSFGDKERLIAFLENKGKVYLQEAQFLAIKSNMVGIDGNYMDAKLDNVINLRESSQSIELKLRQMPTDPARVRRTDAGNPEKCPVWQIHKVYSNTETLNWAEMGCLSANIGCLECKESLQKSICSEQDELSKLAENYLNDQIQIQRILTDGCNNAKKIVSETLNTVKKTLNIDY